MQIHANNSSKSYNPSFSRSWVPQKDPLPSFPRQLVDSPCNFREPFLKPRSPPLTRKPLPLQPRSLMKLLFIKVALDLIPCNQTPQHTDTSHNIPATASIQVHRAAIRRTQTRIIPERFLLLDGQGRHFRRLVLHRGFQHGRGQGHGAKV